MIFQKMDLKKMRETSENLISFFSGIDPVIKKSIKLIGAIEYGLEEDEGKF